MFASLGYLVLHGIADNLLGQPVVFGGLFRMFMYHEEHPFSYIAVVCFVYAGVATIAGLWVRRHRLRKKLLAWLVIPVTILLASIPGGMLWVIHDMAAGHFLTGLHLYRYLAWGAVTGLKVGWLIILLSVPYNILGAVIGYYLTQYGFNWLIKNSAPNPSSSRHHA
ncbi:MAG: hypothetical protein R3E60_03440 [Alphaproteobacteria bacterium]